MFLCKQEITRDLMNNVKNANHLYSKRNEEIDLNNNNVPRPSSESSVIEENLNLEIKYQEEKIQLNNISAKRMMDEAQKIITENQKLANELEKLRKRQRESQSARKKKKPRK